MRPTDRALVCRAHTQTKRTIVLKPSVCWILGFVREEASFKLELWLLINKVTLSGSQPAGKCRPKLKASLHHAICAVLPTSADHEVDAELHRCFEL